MTSPGSDPRVIVVTGPTASGKSALALALAERRDGTVINADAMQTYDAFPILTAQPTLRSGRACRTPSTACCRSAETVSAARWRDARVGRNRAGAGRVPILCGGSGLYLRTLMQGIAPIPDAPPNCASRPMPTGQLWVPMRSAPGWPKRIRDRRAAEAGRPAAACAGLGGVAGDRPAAQRLAGRRGLGGALAVRRLLLSPERLAAGTDRTAVRRDAGPGRAGRGADRVRSPARSRLARPQGAWRTRALAISGRVVAGRGRQIAIDHTRQYAKRQMTWFRHQMTPVFDLRPDPNLSAAEKYLDNLG